jgi:D-alanyl-D-alanine carboxypeptidase
MRRLVVGAVAATLLAIPLPAGAAAGESLTVWESGGLDDSTMAAARLTAAIQGGSLAVVHDGTLRMMSVTRDEGPVQQPEDGFGYPMAVSAVAVGDAGVIDPELPAALRRGLVMGERTAALRGARVGDRVVLEGWDDQLVQLGISAILPDRRLGWSEIVISAETAAGLSFDRPSSAVIHGVDPHRAEAVFEGLAPDRPIQVGLPDEPISFSDPTLPAVVLKERFGEFSFRPTGQGDGIEIDEEWLDANIVTVSLPVLGVFECNRAVVPYIRGAIAEMERTGAVAGIDPVDFQLAGGCFNSRMMRGGDKGLALSRHAWGAAIDFNPSTNPYGEPGQLDPAIGEIMRGWGFAWGAGWTVPDGMHFEWTHIPEVREACGDLVLRAPEPDQVAWQVLRQTGPCAA